LIVVLIILLAIFSAGCAMTGPSEKKTADFSVVSTNYGMASWGSPNVTAVVKNKGDGVATYVTLSVTAIKHGVKVDEATIRFLNGGEVGPGESAEGTGFFRRIDSHDDYDDISYLMDWID